MAEQWPFKPFVEGSSPPALTKVLLLEDFLLMVSTGEMLFESPRTHKKEFSLRELFYFNHLRLLHPTLPTHLHPMKVDQIYSVHL